MKKKLRKSTVKPVVKPKIPSRSRILESLTGSDALSILEILADRDAGLAREIDAVAGELLGEVNVAGVAANVKDELESWHRGSQSTSTLNADSASRSPNRATARAVSSCREVQRSPLAGVAA